MRCKLVTRAIDQLTAITKTRRADDLCELLTARGAQKIENYKNKRKKCHTNREAEFA